MFTSVSSNFKDLVIKEKIVKKIGAQLLEVSTTKIKENSNKYDNSIIRVRSVIVLTMGCTVSVHIPSSIFEKERNSEEFSTRLDNINAKVHCHEVRASPLRIAKEGNRVKSGNRKSGRKTGRKSKSPSAPAACN